MMVDSEKAMLSEKPAGDAAVDGVLAGLAAGLASALFLIIAGVLSNDGPGTVIGRFDPGLAGNPLVGGLLHLATSAVYGILFALVYRLISRRWSAAHRFAWLLGLVYGLFLLLVAEIVFLSGIESSLSDFTTLAFIVFHMVYGLILGYLLEKVSR